MANRSSIAATGSGEDKTFQTYGGNLAGTLCTNTKGVRRFSDLIDDKHIRIVSKGLGDTDCYSDFDETDLAYNFTGRVEEVCVAGSRRILCKEHRARRVEMRVFA